MKRKLISKGNLQKNRIVVVYGGMVVRCKMYSGKDVSKSHEEELVFAALNRGAMPNWPLVVYDLKNT